MRPFYSKKKSSALRGEGGGMMWVANKTQLSRFGVLGKETRELSIGTTSPKLFLLGGSGQATTGTCSMFFLS